ncbi:hypothetical protein F7725_013197 [Dissostichus mawsoni]|uniref:Fructose-1,6-bisphosphatase isozyme 2 n=1 Tax=Dissostichus mawsoni TaxID=36200 RepID=A0A7J5YPV0_DISMA|nr:hypothetical protein F7725_013197 [Dissostichus mawsoni]
MKENAPWHTARPVRTSSLFVLIRLSSELFSHGHAQSVPPDKRSPKKPHLSFGSGLARGVFPPPLQFRVAEHLSPAAFPTTSTLSCCRRASVTMTDQGAFDTNVVTMTRFVMEEGRKAKGTGELTTLLNSLCTAVKAISSAVRKGGIAHLYGIAGSTNVTGDQVKKLDILSNDLVINMITSSFTSCVLVSEENEKAIIIEPETRDALRPGRTLVAAGYALYGSATMMVISTGQGVNCFMLDPAIGEFILVNRDVKIKERGKIYSLNEGYAKYFDPAVTEYLQKKKFPEDGSEPYAARYIGSMVADVHRTLMYGGIFLYPGNVKSPKGKLRLLYEGNPMAFIIEQAGGLASTGLEPILDIQPESIHQRAPVAMGSKEDVLEYISICQKHAQKKVSHSLPVLRTICCPPGGTEGAETSMSDQSAFDTDVWTLTRFIIETGRQAKGATGELTQLINAILTAVKAISCAVRKAGLAHLLHPFNERSEVKVSCRTAASAGRNSVRPTAAAAWCPRRTRSSSSPPKDKRGKYVVCFDPLDGSSNIDCLASIGTIFAIYKRVTDGEPTDKDALQAGNNIVCAGYTLYGSATLIAISTGAGLHFFTLDPAIGEFILTERNVKIKQKGKIYSLNEGYAKYFHPSINEYLQHKKYPEDGSSPYGARYVGSMVSDIHRTIAYGGIFMYPANEKSPKGKLRLLYECNPIAFLIEQAGGLASTGFQRVLDIQPEELHQRVPFVVGSPTTSTSS